MKNKNLLLIIFILFGLLFMGCNNDNEEKLVEEVNSVKDEDSSKEFKVSFSAVFEDGKAIPHIGIWYLTGTEEYVENWKDASTDLAFGGASNTDENGVKEQRYLKPNYRANLSKKWGKDQILLAKEDAKYLYIILEPRDGEDFVKLLVNGKEIDEVKMNGFQSSRLKLQIKEDSKIQLICKRDANYGYASNDEVRKIDMQFIAYYINAEGKEVYPDTNDTNNRLKGIFDIGKTYMENDIIKDFVTYKYKGGVKTSDKRSLSGKFKIKQRVSYNYKTMEYSSLLEFKEVELGSEKTNEILVFFEYKN